MEVKLQKWGNSQGIRIPSVFLKSLDLNENDMVNLVQEDDKIIISKVNTKKISLRESFAKYGDNELDDSFEWDEPRGREIW